MEIIHQYLFHNKISKGNDMDTWTKHTMQYLYNNVVLAMTVNIVVRVEGIVHDPKESALCLQPWPLYGIVIANTTLLLLLCRLLYVDKIYWELLQ
jgi:hypothetical protein